MHTAIVPPASRPSRTPRAYPVAASGNCRTTYSRRISRIFGTDTSTEIRRPSNLTDDLFRIISPHEHHDARQHGRYECRHGLSEHVAQRQKIQESEREERPAEATVLPDLCFHGHDIGEDVAMRDDHGLGSAVAPEVNTISAMSSRLTCSAESHVVRPVDIGEPPRAGFSAPRATRLRRRSRRCGTRPYRGSATGMRWRRDNLPGPTIAPVEQASPEMPQSIQAGFHSR